MSNLKEKIILSLKEVFDPEIPINVYDLGLIYEINIDEETNFVKIIMSLTSPTCPTAEFIQSMVKDAVLSVKGVNNASIELSFNPPWNPDRVSEDAKDELGLGDFNEDNIGFDEMFSKNDETGEVITQNLCFNCSKDDSILLIKCKFKGEDVLVCHSCLNKF